MYIIFSFTIFSPAFDHVFVHHQSIESDHGSLSLQHDRISKHHNKAGGYIIYDLKTKPNAWPQQVHPIHQSINQSIPLLVTHIRMPVASLIPNIHGPSLSPVPTLLLLFLPLIENLLLQDNAVHTSLEQRAHGRRFSL